MEVLDKCIFKKTRDIINKLTVEAVERETGYFLQKAEISKETRTYNDKIEKYIITKARKCFFKRLIK